MISVGPADLAYVAGPVSPRVVLFELLPGSASAFAVVPEFHQGSA